MATRLNFYLREFCALRNRDKTGNYEGLSLGGAPHQPVILLVVLDLYAHDRARRNFVEVDGVLLELWAIYKELLGITPSSSGAMPIYALRKMPFWHLVQRPSAPVPTVRVRNLKTFYSYYVGVVLDNDLHSLLQQDSSRNLLRDALVRTYFPSERWLSIKNPRRSLADASLATSAYAQRLLDDPAFGESSRFVEEFIPHRALRDASFRKVVTFAYDYRCAFCGVRLKSPKSHLLVEAAHIVPWHKTHDDRPVNGLSLCPLCHWAFDARMLAVDLNLNILTNNRIQMDDNVPGHLATLKGRKLFNPKEERFLPDEKCLKQQLVEFNSA